MNGALGYMYANHIPYSPDALLKINRKLVADVLEDFNDVTVENARTNGERLYALYGMKVHNKDRKRLCFYYQVQ